MNVREAKQLLNISGKYNKNILTKAFHAKMKEVHPDIHPGMGCGLAQQVQAAYELLKSFLTKNVEDYKDLDFALQKVSEEAKKMYLKMGNVFKM